MSQDVLSPARVNEIHKQAARRRTFAVISHPDAGKSTLTEALALHAKVIGTAGASSGKANRKETVSDWMQMEKDRGISISSAALQFSYRDTVINLLDTPGHADFSEDTYRVLAAVDCAVMLVDAAKGLETQTMKLFEVCKARNLPIITVINKWDRPGLDALALMDEITERTGLQPMPLTWAVGISGDFRGVWDLRNDRFARFQRNNAGANIALTEYFTPEQAAESQGNNWSDAVDEAGLVIESNLEFDVDAFHAGTATPILFSSAALNFGVKEILDALVDFAPPAAPRPDVDGSPRAVESPFSGFVFKVQAGMNKAHRDHVAFIRVCSGVFERGMVVTQTRTGKSFATKYAQQVFGREREVID
ncbi:MAG: GTP-binding protein, partial [Pseudarthrobacter sp.]